LKWKSFDHILTLAESVNFFKKTVVYIEMYWPMSDDVGRY